MLAKRCLMALGTLRPSLRRPALLLPGALGRTAAVAVVASHGRADVDGCGGAEDRLLERDVGNDLEVDL